MKAFTLIALFASTSLGFSNPVMLLQQDERSTELVIEKTFSVKPGETLSLKTGDADVSITTSTNLTDARIEVFLSGRDMSRARRYFDSMNFEVGETSDGIFVESTRPSRSFRDWRLRGQARILVKVHVPHEFNLDVSTSDGDISTDDIEGSVRIRSSDGNLTLNSISGNSVYLSTSDGDIFTEDLVSSDLSVHTSDGDIRLDAISASHIDIKTSDGTIIVESVDGQSTVRTSDGDISIGTAKGSTLSLRTSDGDITVSELFAARSQLKTSDGEIHVTRMSSDLSATSSSGDITISMLEANDILVRSGDGDIVIKVPTSIGARLDLRGNRVDVSSRHDFSGTLAKRSASGSINGGGSTIKAIASDGKVIITN